MAASAMRISTGRETRARAAQRDTTPSATSRSATNAARVAPATAMAIVRCGLVATASATSAAAGERRAERGSARAASPRRSSAKIADQRGDRQVVRAPERRKREGERGQKPVGDAEQNLARVDRRGAAGSG